MSYSKFILLGCVVSSCAFAEHESPDSRELEEVIVTAQKRTEAIEDVSAAVTVVNAETLKNTGVTTLADVQNLIPSVRLQKESASTEIYIRGVGSTLDLPMIEAPNAYHINGVYVPREVTSASFLAVERVEALPGPQGTLYGRGAIGGVINTVLQRPSDETETQIGLEAGNYSYTRTTITHNSPLSENVRFLGALSYHERDGYQASGADSADDLAGLVSLDIDAADNLNIYLWSHIEKREGYAANLVSKGDVSNRKNQRYSTGNAWDDRLQGSLTSFATLGPIDAQERDWDTLLVGGEIKWDINDQLSLTYIPSYLDFEWHQGYWLTHKPGDFGEEINQQTHELRLASEGDTVSWMLGLYNYDIETSGQLFIEFGSDELWPTSPSGLWLDVSDVRSHELKGSALFGETTYSLADNARIVVGGRYSQDKRNARGFQPGIVMMPAVDDSPVGLDGWSNKADWNNFDWKVGLELDVDDTSLLYATVQTGFQPGTFDVFPDSKTAESELLALTVGSKNRLFDNQVIFNTEAFFYEYDSLLIQSFNAENGTNFLTNADVEIYGLQLDLVLSPDAWAHTTMSLSTGYLHARYTDFIEDARSPIEIDAYNGNQMQNAPDWTVSLGVEHDWPLESGATLTANVNSRYESGFWGDFRHSAGLYQESYTKTDAALTYYSEDDQWSIGLWIKNLENQEVQAAAATGSSVFDPGPGAIFTEAPRTYGLRFSMNIAD